MKAIDIQGKRLRSSLLIALVGLFISGCVELLPPDLQLSKLPEVSGQGCVITVIRRTYFLSPSQYQYITLNGVNVAALNAGEYTKFSIPEGHHKIGVKWLFGEIRKFGGLVAGRPARAYHRELAMECNGGEHLSYGIKKDGSMEDNKFKIINVTDFDKDFRLEGKSFVPPGIFLPPPVDDNPVVQPGVFSPQRFVPNIYLPESFE